MRKLIHGRPSPSLAVSIVALFVALGGTATAAGVLIKSSSQIKKGVVNSGDVKDASLDLADLNATTRGAVSGAGTQSLEAYRIEGPKDAAAGQPVRVATLTDIPPGAYAIFAKTVLTPVSTQSGLFKEGDSMSGHCVLDADGDVDHARTLLGSPGSNSPGNLSLQITRTFGSPGTAALICDVGIATWSATNTSIIALRLGKAPRQAVDG